MTKPSTANGEAQEDRARAFYERLRVAMDTADLTEADLARALGASRSTVNGWWPKPGRPASLPSAEYLAQLPSVLRVSADWLLTGHGPRIRYGETGGAAFIAGVRAAMHVYAEAQQRIRTEILGETPAGEGAGVERDPTARARALLETVEQVEAAQQAAVHPPATRSGRKSAPRNGTAPARKASGQRRGR